MKFIIALLCVTVFSPAATALAQRSHPPERALASVWRQHIGNPHDHRRMIHLCALFKAKNPDNPLLPVSETLAAWHLLKLQQTNAAVTVLEPIAEGEAEKDHLRSAARDMARAWLTRIDRERTMRALRRIYLDKVEYPVSLDALAQLPEKDRPRIKDRWGKRWTYELVGFKYIRGAAAQRYMLHSITLGTDSDLNAALARSYASRIDLVPEKLARGADEPTVLFRHPTAGLVRLQPGQDFKGARLAYVGKAGIILADYSHWLILPRPRRRQ